MARTREGAATDLRGRIAAGDVVLWFGSPHGALAERLEPDERPAPKPRPASPPTGPFPDVIDRVDEIEHAGTALVAARPVLLHGPLGSGKTTLLRHLSRTAANDAPDGAGAWPDGTILVSARGAPADDLLQLLFRALHTSDTPVHATRLQLENGLRERQALVLVDDLRGAAAEVRTILDTASACAFAIASEADVDEIDVVRVGLGALPPDAGVELIGRATDHEPSPLEAARIRELHRAVNGRPLLLLQTAALLHAGAVSLEAASGMAEGEDPPGALADRLDETLSETLRGALLALEAVRPASLAPSDVAAIADLDDPGGTLEALAHHGLARVEGARYGGAGGLGARVAGRHDPEAWKDHALDHFASRAGAPPSTARSGPERAVLVWALDRAVAASRWRDAVALSRAVELDLALSGRWRAWGEVLERALESAGALDDASAEAWALHERGTRALALGESERAIHDLERAIELREAIGEQAAAEASRSNLSLLLDETSAHSTGPGAKRSSRGPTWALLAVALVILGAIGLLVLRGRGGESTPVETGSVRFEEVAVGGESLAPVVVSNAHPGVVEVEAVEIDGVDATDFSILQDGCTGTRLQPEEGCVLVVGFRPGEPGERSARLRIPFRDDRPRVVALSGRGLARTADGGSKPGGESLGIAPERVSFGEQPVDSASGALPIAFVNRGDAARRIAVRLDGDPDAEFSVESDRCSNESLPPGESCLVEVRFRPAEPGLRSGSLVVRDLGADDTRRVSLSGTGTGGAATVADTISAVGAGADTTPVGGAGLSAGTVAVDFGEVPAGTRGELRSVEIENAGAQPVQVSTVRLGGLDAAVFSVVEDRCSGLLLAPGATCSVDLAFAPTEQGGWSARLIVRDPTGDGVDVDLAGTGG